MNGEMKMKGFKITLIASIKRKAFTREYYEQTISKWLLKGWITEEEADECIAVLNEEFPVEQTE